MEEKTQFRNSRNQNLSGIMHLPDVGEGIAFPVAIFAHGKGSSKGSTKAKELSRILPMKGIGLFRFDFTGCGESDGRFDDTTVTRLNDDLKSAFRAVASHPNVDSSRIGIVGSSLGGMVTVLAMSEGMPAKTAVLVSPATDYKENHRKLKADNAMSNDFYIDIWKRDFFGLARSIRRPCLIIHGNLDDVCFLSGSEKLLQSLPRGSKLEIIGGEGHFYRKRENFDRMISLTVSWLLENL